MAQISRRILNKDIEERMYELFWKGLAGVKNTNDVSSFLKDLLSPTEELMLSKRLGIAILLVKGYTYAAINQILKVSPPTIAKVNFYLRHGSDGYQRVVKKILQDERIEELLDLITEFLLKASGPKAVGSAGHFIKSTIGKAVHTRRNTRATL